MRRNNLDLKTNEKDRKATWLELFYDLIYVIVIAKLTHHLTHPHHHHITPTDFAIFMGLFVPVWWAWTGHTLFANRFDPDDTFHRLLTLMQMFGAVMMAVFIDDAFGKGGVGFALSYVFIRTVLIIMYLRVFISNKSLRPVSGRFITGFSIGAAIWLISVFVDPPLRYFLWAAGLLIEFATPWVSHRLLNKISVHASHLPERLGLLTIIVMGEAVLSVTNGISTTGWTVPSVVASVSGFLLLASVWWLYFESLERSLVGAEFGAGQLTIYGHLFVYAGLVILAAGIYHSITPGIPDTEIGWLICGGLLFFLIPLQIIHGRQLPRAVRLGFVARNMTLNTTLIVLAFATPTLGATTTIAIVALAYLLYVLIESQFGIISNAED